MHVLEEKEEEEEKCNEDKIQLRRRTVSETSILPKQSRRKRKLSVNIPLTSSPARKGNSGRKQILLTEQQQDQIR